MRRGDIWLLNLDPALGNEAAKVRPGLIVSNDGANAAAAMTGRGVVTVVPLTTNVASVWPFQVLLDPDETGLRAQSKIQCEQVRAVSIQRLLRPIGGLTLAAMQAVDAALRLHLQL